MSSKSAILSSIRQNTQVEYPCPDLKALEVQALTFADPISQFAKVLEQGGGRAIVLPEGKSVAALVAELYPNIQTLANTLPDLPEADKLPGRVFNPDSVDQPAELNGTDLAIIRSSLGVAENACCWIEEYVRHRAIFFIAEALIIVIKRTDIVNNMHEAYRLLPDCPEVPFGCFISGPSKTADIEQALVFGAHGAKEVTVVIV